MTKSHIGALPASALIFCCRIFFRDFFVFFPEVVVFCVCVVVVERLAALTYTVSIPA